MRNTGQSNANSFIRFHTASRLSAAWCDALVNDSSSLAFWQSLLRLGPVLTPVTDENLPRAMRCTNRVHAAGKRGGVRSVRTGTGHGTFVDPQGQAGHPKRGHLARDGQFDSEARRVCVPRSCIWSW